MGYSYVYPPLGKKESKAQPQSRSTSHFPSPLQLRPQKQIQQRSRQTSAFNSPPQALLSQQRKPTFPDFQPPKEFQNFMSSMTHKFPFSIAKKRDGLLGNKT